MGPSLIPWCLDLSHGEWNYPSEGIFLQYAGLLTQIGGWGTKGDEPIEEEKNRGMRALRRPSLIAPRLL
jgi:hypothetical protein